MGHTLKRVNYLRQIHAVVLDALPPELSDQVHTAAYERAQLTLHVANGSLATRLRYMQPQIARALARQHKLPLNGLEVRVRPGEFAPPPPARPRLQFPDRVADQMHSVAEGIDYRPLADALKRLAASGRVKSE